MRGVLVRHDEGQGDTVPSSLPRGLSATMPEDQRQMSHVQARAQVRLNNTDTRVGKYYSFDCFWKDLRDSQNTSSKRRGRVESCTRMTPRVWEIYGVFYTFGFMTSSSRKDLRRNFVF